LAQLTLRCRPIPLSLRCQRSLHCLHFPPALPALPALPADPAVAPIGPHPLMSRPSC